MICSENKWIERKSLGLEDYSLLLEACIGDGIIPSYYLYLQCLVHSRSSINIRRTGNGRYVQEMAIGLVSSLCGRNEEMKLELGVSVSSIAMWVILECLDFSL